MTRAREEEVDRLVAELAVLNLRERAIVDRIQELRGDGGAPAVGVGVVEPETPRSQAGTPRSRAGMPRNQGETQRGQAGRNGARGGGRFGLGAAVGRARTGDRVQILNYVSPGLDQEWSESDQVGIVARVTKARVHVVTDSGQTVQRAFGNVEVIERARDRRRAAGMQFGRGGWHQHM